jgi:hypothetical protein
MDSAKREKSRSPRRSRSPQEKRRSRSPDRRKPRRGGGGFKWKDKSNDKPRDDYRDRSDSYRPNRYRRDEDDSGSKPRDHKRSDRDPRSRNDYPKNEDSSRKSNSESKPERSRTSDDNTKFVKNQKTSTAPPTFITVFVNDRLGTRAQIPCLPSDTIGLWYHSSNFR